MPSSFVRRTPSTVQPPPPGTIPCPSAPSLPILSTGVPSLDDILGGGQPLGSIFTVLAPDEHSSWGRLVERYWIAQGLASGQDVVLVGGGSGEDEKERKEVLKSVVKGCMWIDEGTMNKSSGGGAAAATEDADSDAEGLEEDSGNRTRIAWRYEKMKRFETTVGASNGSNSASSSFSHALNLTTPLPSSLITHLESTSQLSYIPLSHTSATSSTSNAFTPFLNALQEIKALLEDKGVLDERLPGAGVKEKGKGKRGKVVRVVIHELGGLDWGDGVAGCHIHRFLHSLRQLIRHSTASVLITLPSHLSAQPPIPFTPSTTPLSTPSPVHWLPSLTRTSDALLSLQGFASSPTLSLSFPLSHGLLTPLSLPIIQTLSAPALKHSQLLGLGGQGATGENNLSFRLKRKRWVVETLHLGVEGGVGERRTEGSKTGGAIDAVRHGHGHTGHSHDGHAGHSHGHDHGPGVQPQQGIEIASSGEVPPAPADAEDGPELAKPRKKSVGFSGVAEVEVAVEATGAEDVAVQKKERKKVGFRHDKPELYEF